MAQTSGGPAPKRSSDANTSIPESGLAALAAYKYSAVDKSPIAKYILKHYWNACVEILPLWLAPNMVTLIGFLFIIGNVGLLELFDHDLQGTVAASPWLMYSYAIGVWMYSTMDNIDGKQARRTGTSSGLGELFDHGIDSLNCTLASLLEASAMGLGNSRLSVFTAIVPVLPMFISTWETYHTHTLYLGYFNGPTEGLMIVSLIMLVSGLYGSEVWQLPLSDAVGMRPILGNVTFVDIWAPFILTVFAIAHVPPCVKHVVQARRARNLPIAPVFLGLLPLVLFVGALIVWLESPDSYIIRHNHICLLCITMSFVFGRLTTKIILAHLTRQSFPYWTVMLAPLLGGAMLVNVRHFGYTAFSPDAELLYLRLYLVFSMLVYCRWAYLVIDAICGHLGINCLTIPREKW